MSRLPVYLERIGNTALSGLSELGVRGKNISGALTLAHFLHLRAARGRADELSRLRERRKSARAHDAAEPDHALGQRHDQDDEPDLQR